MTTVDFEPLTVQVQLREEPQGIFRVGKSRVLLDLVKLGYKQRHNVFPRNLLSPGRGESE